MEDNNKCIWNEFTNKYKLSKTLRFELKPIGKTLENIKEKGLIEEDKKREKDFNKIKKILDNYYKDFIEISFSKIELNIKDLEEYSEIYNKLKKEKINIELQKKYKKIQDKIRKDTYNKIKTIEPYNKLFKGEILKNILPKWLEKNNYSEDDINLVKSFEKKWKTYFTGFFENRKNVFSEKPIPTSIIYRAINDNLPKFLDNLDKFKKIQELDDFSYNSVEEQLSEKLNNTKLNNFFTLDNYNNLLNQKGIDLFNLIIGGKSENEQKIQGLNELINLYSQKITDKNESRKIKKLKMLPLFKQILSDKESFSDKLEPFKNNKEVIDSINEYYTNIYLKNYNKLIELINNINKYDIKQIYIKNDSSLKTISKQILGDWEKIHIGLKEFARKELNINNNTKINSFLKQKYFSVYEIEESIKLLKIDNKQSIYDYLSNFYKKINKPEDNKKNKLITDIEEKYNLFKNIEYNNLNRFSNQNIEIIKDFLDSIMDLIHFIKPLYIKNNVKEDDKHQEAYEVDSDFYNQFNDIYKEQLSQIIPLYNKTRNFISKKLSSTKKFKLNFDNSNFLKGWSSKFETNSALILRKKNNYYLAIVPKKLNEEEIDKLKDFNSLNKIEVLNYDFQKADNKNMARTFIRSKGDNFAPSVEKYNLPVEKILDIYDNGYFRTNYREKNIVKFKESLIKLIDYFKEGLKKHESYKHFDFKWKESGEYKDISEFYHDVEVSCYNPSFYEVDYNYIENLMEEKKIYLFQIYNKDFSKYSKGKPNLHTIYWRELFSKENFNNIVYKLNGEAEIFFREKAIDKNKTTIHNKNELINNKNPINNKKQSIFEYDLIKDKRYTENKFLFHCPITINFKAKETGTNLHKQVNKFISLNKEKDIYVLGIDRGERHLAYYTLLDSQGNIIKQKSFNLVMDNNIKREKNNNYQYKLDEIEKDRNKARKNWRLIRNIKDLKEGYLSQVIHEISQLVIKYNAVIALENLNYGFKKGRLRIDKQIYQKFEKMLINKLNYLIFKNRSSNEIGGSLKGYQLTNKFESFKKLGKQSGIIYYVPANFTSKIDPKTGFVNLIWPKYETIDKSIELFNKFNYITYNKEEDLFEFNFNYSNFIRDQKIELVKDKWSIWSNGIKLVNFRNENKNNEWDTKEVNVTDELKKLFNKYSIEYENQSNLIPKITLQDSKDFFYNLISNLKLILQLRNSKINDEKDYILSCVKDKNGDFFNSYNAKDNDPKNADANGAYHIAFKGLIYVNKIKQQDNDKIKLDKITNKEYFNEIIKKRWNL